MNGPSIRENKSSILVLIISVTSEAELGERLKDNTVVTRECQVLMVRTDINRGILLSKYSNQKKMVELSRKNGVNTCSALSRTDPMEVVDNWADTAKKVVTVRRDKINMQWTRMVVVRENNSQLVWVQEVRTEVLEVVLGIPVFEVVQDTQVKQRSLLLMRN